MTDHLFNTFRENNILEINAKSLHPYLLAFFIHDPNRQSIYIDIVNRGIYNLFVDNDYTISDIKRSFHIALSENAVSGKELDIRNYIFEEFPEIFFKQRDLIRKNSSLHKKLNHMELEIFVDGIFRKSNFWCFPIKGRLVVMKANVSSALMLYNHVVTETLGFTIPVEIREH
jgi:hypothetical protein